MKKAEKVLSGWGLVVVLSGLLFLALFFASTGTSQVGAAAPLACVPGPHSGVITGTQQWCLADSPHLLSGDVTVPAGMTLTVEADVVVMGAGNAELLVEGHLEALGTPTEPITITSVTDTGGGQWQGVLFDGGTGHLRHATVRYGGGGSNSAGILSDITVRDTLAGEVLLENCQVLESLNAFGTEYGLYINNGRATISDTLFSGNGNGGAAAPLYIAGPSSVVTLTENTFTGNSRDRIVLAPGAMMGHDATLTPQAVLQGYEMVADFTVPPTVTLTLEPGVKLMGAGSVELLVEGHLEALGTPTEPITITSVTDTGGGQWQGVLFDGGTGHLRHVTVRYGGGQPNSAGILSDITVRDTLAGEVLLENCQVLESLNAFGTEYGLYIDNGRVNVSDTLFSGNGNGGAAAPLYIAGADSVVTLTENSFTGNSRDRIVLAPGAMMGHDATLTPQAVLQGYEMAADFTVPPTVTLTLEPGVKLMGAGSVELLVEGHLEALGTPTEPITITSVTDTGGGQWQGVLFDGGSGHLRHVTVRYGGGGTNSAGILSDITVWDTLAGEVLLESCQVLESLNAFGTEYGLYINNGRATVNDTLFGGNGNGGEAAPLYIAGVDSIVAMMGNTFSGNSRDRVVLADGAMTGHDATLRPHTGLQGYELDDDLTVLPSVTWTLDPGTTLLGQSGVELAIQGDLQALGTAAQPITLTSLTDSGGGQWSGVVFDGSASLTTGGGTGHLRHAEVRYGGQGNSAGTNANISVQNTNAGEVLLENCQVRDSSADGVHVSAGQACIQDTTMTGSSVNVHVVGESTVLVDASNIESATSHGLLVEGDEAWVLVTDSTLWSNGAFAGDGVRNAGEATVILSGDPDEGNFIAYNQDYGANQAGLTGQTIATYNYWGDPSGPTHSGNPGGTGEEVSDRVLYEPWLTEVPTETLGLGNLIEAVGPRFVSSGETVNLGFIVHNVLTETLENTLLIATLPTEVEYLLSWPQGDPWPQRQQVVWQLGDVAPGEVIHVAVQVRYAWGLAPHLEMHVRGLVSADNLPNPLIDHDLYTAYESVTVTERVQLSQPELDAELAADSDLQALYDQALAEGFVFFGNAYSVTQSTGAAHLEIIFLPGVANYGDTLAVLRMEGWSRVMRSTPDALLLYDLDGGYELNLDTREHRFWGTWAEGPEGVASCVASGTRSPNDCIVDETTCLRNCLVQKLGSDALQILVPLYGAISTAGDCAGCAASGFTDPEDCGSCGANIAEELGADYLSIFNDLHFCSWNCRYNESFRQEQVCTESETWCSTSWLPLYGYLPVVMERECDTINCVWLYLEQRKDWCSRGEICIQSPTIPAQCCNPLTDPLCPCIGELCDDNPHENLAAGDPNEMYGPMAAAPGETISYTIACENVGEGTAYGVYIDSVLPEGLDDSTLKIGGNGVYYPATRKLFWNIGELAPSAGDRVTFTVQIPTDVVSNTVLVAKATVYFPSVPETTPTNDIVTIVGDVVGYPQQVETTEGVATPITLSGWSPTGNPLTYAIVQQPLNGDLTGTAPALTYTPVSGFEGLDSFAFGVSDGVNTSLPAEVTIAVNTGVEITPPEVRFTIPRNGQENVAVYDTPVYTDTYMPIIWVMFSEPIDASTVTAASFLVADAEGQPLDGVVAYDGTQRVARFLLGEPLLSGETYTARLTTAIKDTSGNPLAADVVWSFATSTSARHIYLPLVLRGY